MLPKRNQPPAVRRADENILSTQLRSNIAIKINEEQGRRKQFSFLSEKFSFFMSTINILEKKGRSWLTSSRPHDSFLIIENCQNFSHHCFCDLPWLWFVGFGQLDWLAETIDREQNESSVFGVNIAQFPSAQSPWH